MDVYDQSLKEENKNLKTSFWDFKGEFDFVDKWFLMENPLPLILITTSYLLFVLKIGPEMMKYRKPFKLTTLLAFYNAFQVLASCYLFSATLNITMREGLFPKHCMRNTETINMVTSANYYYLICKMTELLDTVFFVLRKKQNQVTFLHVYHHFLIFAMSWITLKYEPGLAGMFLGMLNSFVHVVMYTYYGLSAFPDLSKYLWWKKYITKLQLVQFVLIIVQLLINEATSECKSSKLFLTILIVNLVLFLYLFGKFYVDTYKRKNKVQETQKENVRINASVNAKSFQNGSSSSKDARTPINGRELDVKFSIGKKEIHVTNGNYKRNKKNTMT